MTPSTVKRFSRGECVCCETVLHSGGGDGIQGSQAAGGGLASAGAWRSRGGPCPALCGAVLVEGRCSAWAFVLSACYVSAVYFLRFYSGSSLVFFLRAVKAVVSETTAS